MTASTRRAALGVILAAPLAGGAAAVTPSWGGKTPPQSDLARACLWAIGQTDFINTTSRAEHWDDVRVDEEMERYDAVFSRALTQPSADLSDLVAKARLCLLDFESHHLQFRDADGNVDADDLSRMVATVLREVITLCA